MRKVRNDVAMTSTRLRIRNGLKDESITIAAARQCVAAAAAGNRVTMRTANKSISFIAANEDKRIMRSEVSVNSQIGPRQIV